jgi:hypothetical protein
MRKVSAALPWYDVTRKTLLRRVLRVKIAKQKNVIFCLAHAFGGAPGERPGGRYAVLCKFLDVASVPA